MEPRPPLETTREALGAPGELLSDERAAQTGLKRGEPGCGEVIPALWNIKGEEGHPLAGTQGAPKVLVQRGEKLEDLLEKVTDLAASAQLFTMVHRSSGFLARLCPRRA